MNFGGRRSSVAINALGQMVGLILALYVFDQIIDAIISDVAGCTAIGMFFNSSNNLCQETGNVSNTSAVSGYFASVITFVDDLLPVIGIIAAFGIMYNAIKKMGLL